MKVCTTCKLDLIETAFSRDKRNKSGLQSSCNECRKKQKAEFRNKIRQGIGLKVITHKHCTGCDKTKEVKDFFKSASLSDGYHTQCKECKNKTLFPWRARKKEVYNEYMRTYRRTHPEKYEQARNRGLKHRYGITSEQYDEMLLKQNYLCAICRKLPKGNRRLVVDHNHATGVVRGLLCDGCNVAISIMDNPPLHAAAKAYLGVP